MPIGDGRANAIYSHTVELVQPQLCGSSFKKIFLLFLLFFPGVDTLQKRPRNVRPSGTKKEKNWTLDETDIFFLVLFLNYLIATLRRE